MVTAAIAIIGPVILLIFILDIGGPSRTENVIAASAVSGNEEDVYAQTPMCDKNGKCGEPPEVPSPRTVYSARSARQYSRWSASHDGLKRSAADFAARRRNDPTKKRALILLGDSITESWTGTSMGEPVARAEGVPDVLKKMAAHNFLDPLVLGIGGDQTQHLIYRLQDAELLPEFADDDDAVFVVLIGTNNLGAGILPGPTIGGVRAVAEYILENTKGNLAVMELLPRGDGQLRLPKLCPPRCTSDGDPFESFMPAVTKVNAAIEKMVPELKKQYGRRIGRLDCGEAFLSADAGSEVDSDLMPDLLHPNAHGHELLAQCILLYIDGIAV
eukprot:CAMPEP_0194273018 /NCGR_PEP_ID=MMETSP0169-20130528/6441_1 /TAXON_ID=218684 /ORGANISM="Corethron pennatum, Strain L29A3" /LENGTH=329 /DNA_ID=CAMNT_0039015835 /DNA_START=184 /DNA_END=1173 /DNA_ORIENTATION=+